MGKLVKNCFYILTFIILCFFSPTHYETDFRGMTWVKCLIEFNEMSMSWNFKQKLDITFILKDLTWKLCYYALMLFTTCTWISTKIFAVIFIDNESKRHKHLTVAFIMKSLFSHTKDARSTCKCTWKLTEWICGTKRKHMGYKVFKWTLKRTMSINRLH